ncbi:hypothetical protein KIN20_019756 [Parelaphostrongylus tenuis]|uniref:Uncharacterized protein n=1 Tax=Parelaphostrongylus tenuis TaxID=148309 RepID=A0AAD5QT71_PARTN|nr:hypothetical protein KIN20_019756 [Parelaphostrongylus tenuis]
MSIAGGNEPGRDQLAHIEEIMSAGGDTNEELRFQKANGRCLGKIALITERNFCKRSCSCRRSLVVPSPWMTPISQISPVTTPSVVILEDLVLATFAVVCPMFTTPDNPENPRVSDRDGGDVHIDPPPMATCSSLIGRATSWGRANYVGPSPTSSLAVL